jgi:hypothetical protein
VLWPSVLLFFLPPHSTQAVFLFRKEKQVLETIGQTVISIGMILTPVCWTIILVLRPEEDKLKRIRKDDQCNKKRSLIG